MQRSVRALFGDGSSPTVFLFCVRSRNQIPKLRTSVSTSEIHQSAKSSAPHCTRNHDFEIADSRCPGRKASASVHRQPNLVAKQKRHLETNVSHNGRNHPDTQGDPDVTILRYRWQMQRMRCFPNFILDPRSSLAPFRQTTADSDAMLHAARHTTEKH